jgi:hypothetical protein
VCPLGQESQGKAATKRSLPVAGTTLDEKTASATPYGQFFSSLLGWPLVIGDF